ncbi:MAG: hypothetical protein ABJ004_15750 [Cyclobacteriaceae bacterium]
MKTQEEISGLSQRKVRALLSLFHFRLSASIIAGLLSVVSYSSFAQGDICRNFTISDTIKLDSLPVESGSLRLFPPLSYTFDPKTNSIIINGDVEADSIEVCYRTIPRDMLGPYFNRDIQTYSQGRASLQPNASTVNIIPKEEIFSFSDFDSYGAISRGVTFGNRQNLFVNSALNLQLDGQLAENLFVSASITDQNIPYQPEGNTQQIRDFDNVYIKLYNDNFDITAGDVVLTNPVEESYFLKYYKNVQGLNLNYKYHVNDNWKATTSFSGSAAKGQFSSSQLTPIEGVQGPYRLVGPNGERFIIVMANSERVFIDGKLLERGFDRDYIIDYNLGEITFSNSIVITRFTRIRVDFEYAEQYYSRSNINLAQQIENDKLKFYFNYYQEKDSPGGTLGYELSDSDLEALARLGDNQGLGLISGIDSIGYINEAVLYEKADTVTSGITYDILKYSTNPSTAEFRVSFTEVGAGNGNYNLAATTANGRVYEWVAPVQGASQGSYEPVRVIPLPNKKQMWVLGNTVRLSGFETLQNEFAFSNQDQNLYSDLDDDDNVGLAWKSSINSSGRTFQSYIVKAAVSYEAVDRQFRWIDRFRDIEYDRNWGYDILTDTVKRADNILKSQVSLKKDHKNSLNYQYSFRNRTDVVSGHQHDLNVERSLGPLRTTTSIYHMKNSPSSFEAQWSRFYEDIRFDRWGINPGYRFELDHQKTRVADSVSTSLMHYHMHDWYLQSGDSLNARVRVDYIKRYDEIPVEGKMTPYTEADELKLSFNKHFFDSHNLGITANYRKVKDLLIESTEENILGRLDWEGSMLKNHVKQDLTFSTANTRELRREFVFILVPTGQGTHTWRDENEDGIQDLNEFYEAINVDEKNYAKIFTPTDQYINAFQSTLSQNLDARLPDSWSKKGDFLEVMSRFSFNTNTRINYKSTDNSLLNRLNIFKLNLRDGDVIAAQAQRRYSLYYNRNGAGFAADLNRTDYASKSLLTSGFELRERMDWVTNLRYAMGQGLIVRFKGGLGETTNESDFLDTRNFRLNRYSWAPELVWQFDNSFRVSGKYAFRSKNQAHTEIKQSSSVSDYSVSSTWVRGGKGNLNIQLQWLSIDFEGEKNSYLGYELLEGLQPGQNKKWNINWQQSINRGLQLTIQYNGRKSAGIKPIHTGTMQLTAFF